MTSRDEKRFEEAVKSLQEIQEELSGLTKPMKMGFPESEEKWQTGSEKFETGIARTEFVGKLKKVARPAKGPTASR